MRKPEQWNSGTVEQPDDRSYVLPLLYSGQKCLNVRHQDTFVLTAQQGNVSLTQYLFQQQVPTLAMRCLMTAIVKFDGGDNTSITIGNDHITIPLRNQSEQLPPLPATGSSR